MNSSLFDQTVKQSIWFAVASDLDDVPEEPGIYAWYLPLRGDSNTDLLGYLRSLQSNAESGTPATSIRGESRQRRFVIDRNPPEFDLESEVVRKLSNSMTSSKIQTLANVVLVLSLLAEPIYVGMTEANKGLRSRLKQHLQSVKLFDQDRSWTGQFRTRVAVALQDPNYLRRCLIAYLPVSSLELGDYATRLLEHILIRTIKPAQSIRG